MDSSTTNPAVQTNVSDSGSVTAIGRLESLCRKAVLTQLKHIKHGSLIIEDPLEKMHFVGPEPGPVGKIRIRDFEAYKDIALGGSIGAAEAYMTNDWQTDNLTNVIRLMTLNIDVLEAMEGGMTKLLMPLLRLTHWLNRNTAKGSQRNIAAHYDLGNDFFELFLDPTMMYSSGIFPEKDSSMREASQNKMKIICEKLELKPTDHVVEIGTGWGSMAIYMAEHYGCQVTTTTISKEQYRYAVEKVREKGLEHRITLLLEDYRDLPLMTGEQTFDKLVSVEMIEAVGQAYLPAYMKTVERLLKPGGQRFGRRGGEIISQQLINGFRFVQQCAAGRAFGEMPFGVVAHRRLHLVINQRREQRLDVCAIEVVIRRLDHVDSRSRVLCLLVLPNVKRLRLRLAFGMLQFIHQRRTGAVEPAHHSADGNAEMLGDLVVAEIFASAEHQDGALGFIQPVHRCANALQILARVFAISRSVTHEHCRIG